MGFVCLAFDVLVTEPDLVFELWGAADGQVEGGTKIRQTPGQEEQGNGLVSEPR